jgi:hypothetical protein
MSSCIFGLDISMQEIGNDEDLVNNKYNLLEWAVPRVGQYAIGERRYPKRFEKDSWEKMRRN